MKKDKQQNIMKIKIGQTLAVVKLPNDRMHAGVIVQETTHFVRIYQEKGPFRDSSQESSELFAKHFVTFDGELKEPIRISPILR